MSRATNTLGNTLDLNPKLWFLIFYLYLIRFLSCLKIYKYTDSKHSDDVIECSNWKVSPSYEMRYFSAYGQPRNSIEQLTKYYILNIPIWYRQYPSNTTNVTMSAPFSLPRSVANIDVAPENYIFTKKVSLNQFQGEANFKLFHFQRT